MLTRTRFQTCSLPVLLTVLSLAGESMAADREFPFEVRETAGIRRRNDVITIRSTESEVVDHKGGYRILLDGEPVPAQFRRVEWPGEPPELVADFIGHFQPLVAQRYVLQLTDEPTTGEPDKGLTLTETDDEYRIDSSGLVFWTIRKDLDGLFDFSWKQTDYIAENSPGLIFTTDNGEAHKLTARAPARADVERSGPLATSLRFDFKDWPTGAKSIVRLEFVRTKSWIRGSWMVDGHPNAQSIGAELNLRLDGAEHLVDFGGGDFVYCTLTKDQSAVLNAGPRHGNTVPWSVRHGGNELDEIVTAPLDVPTPRVHGWAHVMDDRRATALAVGEFGETSLDRITLHGDGRLAWDRRFDDSVDLSNRHLEFWLHFVTMPVHIGARTSPRSMQEPLVIRWLDE